MKEMNKGAGESTAILNPMKIGSITAPQNIVFAPKRMPLRLGESLFDCPAFCRGSPLLPASHSDKSLNKRPHREQKRVLSGTS
jgi:hypothetical protein